MTEPHRPEESLGAPAPDQAQPPAMPRWVKITGVVVGVFVVALVAMLALGGGGGHGPERHGSLDSTAPVAALPAAWVTAAGP